MAFPLPNQVVNDLKQNFYWSYLSQFAETKEIVDLEISVAEFLEYIAIDIETVVPYGPDDFVTLYYGMNEKTSSPGVYYFTYMVANSAVSPSGAFVNMGIIDHPTEHLLLEEADECEAVNPVSFNTRKATYELSSIYSPYTGGSVMIDALPNHPVRCSFSKQDFKDFIVDNMTDSAMDLNTLILVFQMGATMVDGVDSNYKVQTPIILTKDSVGIRLDPFLYPGKPFKCKGMDVGKLCPPNCNEGDEEKKHPE